MSKKNLVSKPKNVFTRNQRILFATETVGAGLAVLMLGSSAHAASGTWSYNASTTAQNWSTAADWVSSTIADGAGFTADFSQLDITGNRTTNIDGAVASRTVGTFLIGDSAGTQFAYTIGTTGSGTLTFNNSGSTAQLTQIANSKGDTFSVPFILADDLNVTNNSTNVLTISGGVTGAKNLTLGATTTGGITLSTVTINNGGTITNSGSGAGVTTISSVIGTNVTGVVQNSATSQLTLSGINTFTSGLTIKSGNVVGQTSGAALGAGTVTIGDSSGSANAAALSNGITLTNAITVAAGSSGTLALGNSGSAAGVFSGAVTLANNLTVQSTGTGSINISGNVSGTGNITINAAGSTSTATLSGTSINHTGTITNSGASTVVASISGVIGANVTGITQNSATSRLSISGANTAYAAATTLTAGTLTGTNTANTNVLNAFGTGGLALNGGTLQLRANGASNGSQTIVAGNNVTIGSSSTTIDVNNNGSNATNTISLGNLSIGTGTLNVTGGNSYALRFSGTGLLTGNATINTTTASLSIAGVISESTSGLNFTKTGVGTLTISGANTYTGVTSVLGGSLTLSVVAPSGSAGALGNATSEVLLGDTTGSVAATLNTSVNTGTGIARDIRLQSGNTGVVTINANANGSATGTISGNIILGTNGGTGHGVTLASGAGGNASFATAAYSGAIQDPTGLSGAGGVVSVIGVGTTILSGNNTFTGGLTMSSTLILNSATALGNGGTLTINGGTLSNSTANAATVFSNPQVWAGNFGFANNNLAGNGSVLQMSGNVLLTGTRILTFNILGMSESGVISDGGNGYGIIYRGGGFGNSLTLGGANTFGGGITVVGAVGTTTVITNSTTALGSGQTNLTNNANSKLSLSANLTVDSLTSGINTPASTAGTGTNGTYNVTIVGGGGSGVVGTATISTGNAISFNITNYGTNYTAAATSVSLSGGAWTGTLSSSFGSSSVNLNPGTARTLTIAGTNVSPATYSGVISGTSGNVVKQGAGTQILTGVNTYTGTTSVTGGALIINGSLATASAVTVSGTGTLGGSGTVGGSVAINSGGTIAPGNSIGTLNTGALTLGGTYVAEINASVNGVTPISASSGTVIPGANDIINVTGTVNLTGSTLFLALSNVVVGPNSNTYVLVLNDSTDAVTLDPGTSGFANVIPANGGNFTYSIDYAYNGDGGATGNDVAITFSSVPEPTSLSLIGLGAAGLLRRRRRAATMN